MLFKMFCRKKVLGVVHSVRSLFLVFVKIFSPCFYVFTKSLINDGFDVEPQEALSFAYSQTSKIHTILNS